MHGWLPLHAAAYAKAFKSCELMLSKVKARTSLA